MSELKMPPNGAFCWNELATTDLDAAQNFYKALLGWEIKEGTAPGGGMRYNEIVVGGRHVGGMYSMSEMCGGENAAEGEGAQIVVALLTSLVLAYVLAHFVKFTGAETVKSGALTGFWLWLGFVATSNLETVLFESRPLGL